MSNPKMEKFLSSIKTDTPSLQLYKYRKLIETDEPLARKIKDQIMNIALENRLVSEYKTIFDTLQEKGQLDERYHPLREAAVADISPLSTLEKKYKSENNFEKLAETFLRSGHVHFKYGEYRESIAKWTDLLNMNKQHHNIKEEEYFTEYALSYYYLNEFIHLTKFNSRTADKNILKKSVDLCLLRDMNDIYFRKNKNYSFKNVIECEWGNAELCNNQVINYGDLGFLYSLFTMAYNKKDEIKPIRWSSKLESMLVKSNYKLVLETLEKEKEQRCFLPIINLVYESLFDIIKKRILIEIISAFDRCPFSIIEELTGINEGQLKLFAKKTNDTPYLFDPITKSVVIHKDQAPLFQEVFKLFKTLESKFDNERNALIRPERGEDDERGGYSMKRMGGSGMGGFGGMNRHQKGRYF